MSNSNTPTPKNLAEYRQSEFAAATATTVCLNHAGVAPMPARVARDISAALTGMTADPLAYFMTTLMPAMTNARENFARLIGCPTEHLCFTKNTAHGIALVADGLDFQPGDNVVVADCEYPAVSYPWYGQEWRGVETRLVPMRPDGTLHLDDFAARIDSRTRVVALSWIQFGTGFRADMAAFAELAHAHGAILVADLIQGLGALPCDTVDWGVDVAASGVYKWQLSPAGVGGLYIAPHVLERMHLVNMGAGSVINPIDFDTTKFEPKPNAQRYEEGSPNILGLVGLNAALELLHEVGIDRIAARVLELATLTADSLTSAGFHVVTPRDPASGLPHSPLITFRHPKIPNEALLTALTNAHIAAADRGGNIRLAPHFYNNEEDITRALHALTTL